MKLLVIPHPTDVPDLPDLPDDVSEIVLTLPSPEEVVQWAIEQGPSVSLITREGADLDDETLESVTELIETDDPVAWCATLVTEGDLALIGWDDSDTQHTLLASLTSLGVRALDLTDGYQELVLDASIDVDEIVARVTSEVLKIVRSEMQEMLRSRRYRSAGPKV